MGAYLYDRILQAVSRVWFIRRRFRSNSMEQSPSSEANNSQLVKKFPTFSGTGRFITALTTVRHLSPNTGLKKPVRASPSHFLKIVWILSSHLGIGLPSDLLPSGFPTKTVYTQLLAPIRATYLAHIILDLITRTIFGEEYRSLSSTLCSLLCCPVTPSLLAPDILLSIVFSNTLSLRSSLSVSDHDSHPYKTTGKIIVQQHLITRQKADPSVKPHFTVLCNCVTCNDH